MHVRRCRICHREYDERVRLKNSRLCVRCREAQHATVALWREAMRRSNVRDGGWPVEGTEMLIHRIGLYSEELVDDVFGLVQWLTVTRALPLLARGTDSPSPNASAVDVLTSVDGIIRDIRAWKQARKERRRQHRDTRRIPERPEIPA